MPQCVCVCCPQGCIIDVDVTDPASPAVSGNGCKRGVDYAIAETTRPVRTLTMAVPVRGCLEPVSVKTSAPVPKDRMRDVAHEVSAMSLVAPIEAGKVLIADVCGLGADIIATKSVG